MDRLYSELGKFLSREFQDNIEVWEQQIEPTLGFSATACALRRGAGAALAGRLVLSSARSSLAAGEVGRPTAPGCCRPFSASCWWSSSSAGCCPMSSSRVPAAHGCCGGAGAAALLLPFLPVELTLEFLLSIVSLAQPPQDERRRSAEAVDALIEAGEEEGILEESDRELVRSAVEFGDKIVREVMTPRPTIFAVAAETTLAAFLALLKRGLLASACMRARWTTSLASCSRMTCCRLRMRMRTRTVASLQRPAAFVPETKRVNELLREMQREKQHMRIVIDEYGGVAGLVTIEDLLEEIVGTITDEHEEESEECAQAGERGRLDRSRQPRSGCARRADR